MTKEKRIRKCLVTGQSLPAHKLVRFVCAPDGVIIPDVAAKLPGRGCWITADRDILKEAIRSKRLLHAGRALLKKETENKTVKITDGLLDQIEDLLRKRCLDYIGLANRAGNIISGYEKVRAMLKSGKTDILITASDGAENGRSKMCQGLDNLRVIDMFAREELSKAVGLENAVHLALLPGGIKTSLLREISRYKHCRKKL